MSTSMISTVLDIERQAEDVLKKAAQDAKKIIADANAERERASAESVEKAKREVASLGAAAADERGKKVKELTATGDASLAAVTNISAAAFDSGVKYIMAALAK